VVPVPEPRLAALDALVHSQKVIPATVEFVDIAGLVRGASRGEGLGNQFLAHIRETDAIVHVVRCFDSSDVVHVDGAPDPRRDVETIETELCLADLDTAERRLDRARRSAKGGDKERRAELELFEALVAHLGEGRPARTFPVPDAQRGAFRESFLLTAKPVLYLANVDEAGLAGGNAYTAALEVWAKESGAPVLSVCAQVEAELNELEPAERQAFLADLGLAEPGLHRLIRAAYALLDLASFFTAGPKEVRAWTIRFEDYIAAGGETEAKARGLMRVEGRDYVMQDGDVVYFRIAV
jgi:GTP-binding protein YchF